MGPKLSKVSSLHCPGLRGGQGQLLLFHGFAIKSLMVTSICTTNLQILLLIIQPRSCGYHFNGRKQRGTKEFLMKVKEESEKAGLKLNIQKMKIMASGTITSWQIDGGNNGNSDRFFFLGLQNHCGW